MDTQLTPADISNLHALATATKDNLDRILAILTETPNDDDTLAKLDPSSPLNKSGKFLSERGIEVCYSLFDLGKNRYEVKQLMDISFTASNNRYARWIEAGGVNRKKNPSALD